MKKLAKGRIEKFQKKIFDYYREHGRHHLPWRKTKNPYRVLVSEVMLQQTQVDRVIPKYKAFLKKFPTVESLARSDLREVLLLWKGLGYNNRAKRLRDAASEVVTRHDGRFPKDPELLAELPGIGSYTARAVVAFSYNQDTSFVETNIRRVYLHEFFPNVLGVHDKDILPLIQETLPIGNAKEWYAALMDYGAYLSKQIPNPNRKSKHYAKQSVFEGSLRQGRALILHTIAESETLTLSKAHKLLGSYTKEQKQNIVGTLIRDGLLVKRGTRLALS